ncbi:hypothetical protein [Microbulbifer sp. TYP-18]|uniref:hypothetical protein n=1 Tax=Microbulbifer sp. TYP-18 TaxID=3230024 RepID=UPI0034C684C4
MRPRTIIIDGEPVKIRRFRLERYDRQPMYKIQLLNYLEFYGTYSAAVGCDLRAAIMDGLNHRRAVIQEMELVWELRKRAEARESNV